MNIGSNFTNNIPNFISQNKNDADNVLEKIAATRELSGADNANLFMANSLSSQISSTTQELQNTNETIGMLQIADGALQGISENTMKMEELSVQYNNPALNAEQKNMLSSEFESLKASTEDMISQTSYNGQSLLSGDSPLGLGEISTDAMSIEDGESITNFSEQVTSMLSNVGSQTNEAEVGMSNLMASLTNATASFGQISETPMSEKVNELQESNQKLDAATLAQSHQTNILKVQMAGLLGQ